MTQGPRRGKRRLPEWAKPTATVRVFKDSPLPIPPGFYMADLTPAGKKLFVVGHYAIKQVLGTGGMGTVYLGYDLKTGREAAVKVIRPGLETDDASVRRFRQEFATMLSVRHPGIVQVLDANLEVGNGPAPPPLFIAMERVRGLSLKDRVGPDRTRSLPETLRIIANVADALHEAHERGIVHRDVKPGNIFESYYSGNLENGPEVKLGDFGSSIFAGNPWQLTETGDVLATPDYASPNVLRGNVATPADDFYALAGVAIYLISGRTPPGFSSVRLRNAVEKLGWAVEGLPQKARQTAPAEAAQDQNPKGGFLGDRKARALLRETIGNEDVFIMLMRLMYPRDPNALHGDAIARGCRNLADEIERLQENELAAMETDSSVGGALPTRRSLLEGPQTAGNTRVLGRHERAPDGLGL